MRVEAASGRREGGMTRAASRLGQEAIKTRRALSLTFLAPTPFPHTHSMPVFSDGSRIWLADVQGREMPEYSEESGTEERTDVICEWRKVCE